MAGVGLQQGAADDAFGKQGNGKTAAGCTGVVAALADCTRYYEKIVFASNMAMPWLAKQLQTPVMF